MPFATPFILGPFVVDAAGRLAPFGPNAEPTFMLRWRDRLVRVQLEQPDEHAGRLRLRATLGRVPSSAGHALAALRPESFALLRLLPRNLPPDWRIRLLPDHRVRLEADSQVRFPITAVNLLVELTCFLLALAPYLDMFDEAGMPAPAAGGNADGPEDAIGGAAGDARGGAGGGAAADGPSDGSRNTCPG
jgi:hypothetical protein